MVPYELLGEYECWSCGKVAPVKKTPTGKLKGKCDWCDFPNYADPGTIHFKNLMAKTRLIEQPAPAVDPPPKPKDPPAAPAAPAAPPRRSFTSPLFGMK